MSKRSGSGKTVGIEIGGLRRGPYHHALEDSRAADLRVARRNARKGEVAVAGKAQAFLDRFGNEVRIADQFGQLFQVRVERVQRAAGRPAGGRQRGAADRENLIEQFAVGELVALRRAPARGR